MMRRAIMIVIILAGLAYLYVTVSSPDHGFSQQCVFEETFTCSGHSYDPENGEIEFTLRNEIEEDVEISEIVVAGNDVFASPEINTSTCRSEPQRTIEEGQSGRFTISGEGCRSEAYSGYRFHIEVTYSSQGSERTVRGEAFVEPSQ